MARLFDDALSQYLISGVQSAITTPPFSVAGWVFIDDLTIQQQPIGLLDYSGSELWGLYIEGQDPGDLLKWVAYHSPNMHSATSTAGLSVDTWHHIGGVEAASNSRAVYLDGGNKGTNSDGEVPTGVDRIEIGGRIYNGGGTLNLFVSGLVAEVGFWNAALTEAEFVLLAAGYSPLFVRPESLAVYHPLIRDEDHDIVGGLHLTPYNTPSVGNHPPIIYPRHARVPAGPAAVKAGASSGLLNGLSGLSGMAG